MTDEKLPVAEFAFSGPLRDKLVAAILDGRKISTSSLLAEYQAGEALPEVGARELVIDSAGESVAVIETIQVDLVRLADVGLDHAIAEGEGFRSVAEWRAAHLEFWRGEELRAERAGLGLPALTIDDDTMVVAQRFRRIT
ncbi:MAG: ASCH domain-containing protein [Sciscionella sp.]